VIQSNSPESIFILSWTEDFSQYSALKYSEIFFIYYFSSIIFHLLFILLYYYNLFSYAPYFIISLFSFLYLHLTLSRSSARDASVFLSE
jgi:hypothetical protein